MELLLLLPFDKDSVGDSELLLLPGTAEGEEGNLFGIVEDEEEDDDDVFVSAVDDQQESSGAFQDRSRLVVQSDLRLDNSCWYI